jgi:hypothetical protein
MRGASRSRVAVEWLPDGVLDEATVRRPSNSPFAWTDRTGRGEEPTPRS